MMNSGSHNDNDFGREAGSAKKEKAQKAINYLLPQLGDPSSDIPYQPVARNLYVTLMELGTEKSFTAFNIPLQDIGDSGSEITACKVPGKDVVIVRVSERYPVEDEDGFPPYSPMEMEARYGPFWDMAPVYDTREYFRVIRDKNWISMHWSI